MCLLRNASPPLATHENAQKGDAEAALPLYQRALGIMERTLGADHLETANVLTDIAVIHLEKVGVGGGEGGVGCGLVVARMHMSLRLCFIP